jgi:starvation-inducible outer membrane lipoprotein
MMMFQLKFLFFFLLSVPISACGHVISKEIRKDSDFSFTLRQVSQNPNTYQGKRVIFSKDFYLLALKM